MKKYEESDLIAFGEREIIELILELQEKVLTKADLHKVEMELVSLCDDLEERRGLKEDGFNPKEIMKEVIITKFTDLMSEVA
jgi:hypothetical protein